jgi:hypothetical protein
MRVRGLVAATGAMMVGLAGCGAGAGPAPDAAPAAVTVTQTPAASAAPVVPAELTVAQAAKVYLAIVKPFNDALHRLLEEEGKSSPSLSRLRKRAAACADAEVVFLRALSATKWPASVRTEVEDLAKVSGGMLNAMRAASKATSRARYDAAFETLPPDTGAAQRMRAKLGLPEAT